MWIRRRWFQTHTPLTTLIGGFIRVVSVVVRGKYRHTTSSIASSLHPSHIPIPPEIPVLYHRAQTQSSSNPSSTSHGLPPPHTICFHLPIRRPLPQTHPPKPTLQNSPSKTHPPKLTLQNSPSKTHPPSNATTCAEDQDPKIGRSSFHQRLVSQLRSCPTE